MFPNLASASKNINKHGLIDNRAAAPFPRYFERALTYLLDLFSIYESTPASADLLMYQR